MATSPPEREDLPAARVSPVTAPRFTLRPETEADAPFRLALFRDSRGPRWSQLPLPPELLDPIMAQQMQIQTQAYASAFPAARLEIVMMEDEPVGRLATDRGDDALHLIDIALTPTWRGQGVGEAILRGLMDESRLMGRPLTLTVDPDNLAAQRFYHRLGFSLKEAAETYLTLCWPAPEATA